jgi:hypothetical protein
MTITYLQRVVGYLPECRRSRAGYEGKNGAADLIGMMEPLDCF